MYDLFYLHYNAIEILAIMTKLCPLDATYHSNKHNLYL